MFTLAFDTSSKTASVSILNNDIVLYDTLINVGLNHSEVLLPAIDQACIQTGIKITDIDLFACTIGPGSFTGLRIGASTLKGFMIGTGKPAVGVSSLAAVALNASKSSKVICSVMDAGRGQVYVAYFKYNNDGFLAQISDDRVLSPADIKRDHNEGAIFVGDGAVKYANIILGDAKDNIISAQQKDIRASSVGILGRDKYNRKELLDAETFVPVYLRSADVHIKKSIFEN
jgi:tRNA threonylcarbamoyladenosine biosynthesis protein TsaB